MALFITQAGEGQAGLRGEAEEEGRDGSGLTRTENRPTHPGEGQGERAEERCRARVGITPRVDGVEAAARHRRDVVDATATQATRPCAATK